MKKIFNVYGKSLLGAVIIMIICTAINIPEFMSGWLSCMAWSICFDYYKQKTLA